MAPFFFFGKVEFAVVFFRKSPGQGGGFTAERIDPVTEVDALQAVVAGVPASQFLLDLKGLEGIDKHRLDRDGTLGHGGCCSRKNEEAGKESFQIGIQWVAQ